MKTTECTMPEKGFLTKLLVYAVLAISITISTNVLIDFYGLFRDSDQFKKKIYYNEKVTKYLFSYRYIPSHFEGLLIGPSLSDNLDTQNLYHDSIDYYNASVMGANIYELGRIVKNTVNHGEIKSVILCLHPYITKDYDSKGSRLNEKTYYEIFGSLNLYQSYFVYLIRQFDLMPNKYPKDQFSFNGKNNYNNLFRVPDIESKIAQEVLAHRGETIQVNNMAVSELKNLVDWLLNMGIQVSGYFHPYPEGILNSNRQNIFSYQNEIKNLFDNKIPIRDFNSSDYTFFRENLNNYIDHGHLSKQGCAFIEDQIVKML